jgi:Domain of unknown function (DUF5666)
MSTEPTAAPPTPPRWARTSGLPISLLVLGAILITLIGFGAGYLASDHGDGHRHRDVAFGLHGRVARGSFGMPGPFMGSGSGTAPMPTAGEVIAGAVTSVDGDSFAIHTFRGETISVHTSGATFVRLVSAGTVSGLKRGEIVFVAGTRVSDGSIEASRVLGGFTRPSAAA